MAEAEQSGYFTPSTTPDPLAEQRNKKKSKGKLIFVLILFLVLAGLAGGGYVLYRNFTARDNAPETKPTAPALSTGSENEITTGAGSDDIEESPFGNARFTSENFRVGDIAIAGEAEFLLTEDTIEPLAISGIRGDAFAEKNSQDVSLIVSWRTNKLAKSEIGYSKGVGQTERTVREANYGLTHSLIIPDLEPGTTYVYALRASDRFGTTVASDSHAVYTGSREASLFDLIADAVGDIFGWALK